SINHPMLVSYPGDAKAMQMLDHNPLVLGIEIYNGFAAWRDTFDTDGFALRQWHNILVTGRRCYGFAVPDHWLESAGHPEVPAGANRLLVPSGYQAASRAQREHLCLKAYRNGEW